MVNVYLLCAEFFPVHSAGSGGPVVLRPVFFLLVFALFPILSTSFRANSAERKIQASEFGKTREGETIYRYVLANDHGLEAVIISYGAAIESLKTPDRKGKLSDIVLGYDTLEGYETDKSFFGATIGRYGNHSRRSIHARWNSLPFANERRPELSSRRHARLQ